MPTTTKQDGGSEPIEAPTVPDRNHDPLTYGLELLEAQGTQPPGWRAQ